MGGSPSKLPPIIQRDPLPTAGALVTGIQVGGTTQGCRYCSAPGTCGPCRLAIAQGVSASSAQLYREHGTISVRECTKFAEDSVKVRNREMSLEEFKTNLASGVYYERQDNGFCAQLVANSADLTESTTIDSIPWSKVRRPKIRKLTSGGGYSSITKLYIKPSIPFRVTFNGQTVDVSVMTLFHPSPVRIENVQHDAVLTLGDAGDPSTTLVIMIPLAGTVSPGPESQFIGRIASYVPGLIRPNPVSGLYETISAPTGKDWNLSTMFPGSPSNGQTIVTKGYFAWGSSPPLEEYQKGRIVRPSWLPDTIQYGWRPTTNQSTQFVMLKDPFPISTYDLQSIRMLPVTPPEEAIPPMLPNTIVYNTGTQCSSATPTGTVRESYTNEDGECDAFAAIPVRPFDQSYAIAAYSILFVAVGILLALYVVLWMINNPAISGVFKKWGSAVGDFVGTIAAGKGPAPSSEPESGAEKRLAAPASQVNPLIQRANDAADRAEAIDREATAAAERAKKREQDRLAAAAALARVTGPDRQLTPDQQAQQELLKKRKEEADTLAKEAAAAAAAKTTAAEEAKATAETAAVAAAAATGLSDADLEEAAKRAKDLQALVRRQEAEQARLEQEVKAAEDAMANVSDVADSQQQAAIEKAGDALEDAVQTRENAVSVVAAVATETPPPRADDAQAAVQEVKDADREVKQALAQVATAVEAPVKTLKLNLGVTESEHIARINEVKNLLEQTSTQRATAEADLRKRMDAEKATPGSVGARPIAFAKNRVDAIATIEAEYRQLLKDAEDGYAQFQAKKAQFETFKAQLEAHGAHLRAFNASVPTSSAAPQVPKPPSLPPPPPPIRALPPPPKAPAPAPAPKPATKVPPPTVPTPSVQSDEALPKRFNEATADLDTLRDAIAAADKDINALIAKRDTEIKKLPEVNESTPYEATVHGRAALRVLRSDRNEAYSALEKRLSKLEDEAKSILQEAKDIQAIKGKPDTLIRSTRVFVNTATEHVNEIKELRAKLANEEDETKRALEDYEKTLGASGLSLREAQALNRRAETERKQAWKKGGARTRRRHR